MHRMVHDGDEARFEARNSVMEVGKYPYGCIRINEILDLHYEIGSITNIFGYAQVRRKAIGLIYWRLENARISYFIT